MDPAEVEFLAEKESIKIVPNFTLEEIYMIGVSCEFCYKWILTINLSGKSKTVGVHIFIFKIFIVNFEC